MRARFAYWLMLALVVAGGAGLRALAWRAHLADDWKPAIYRYTADGMPACANLAGHLPGAPLEAGHWLRLGLPQSRRLSARGCVLTEVVPL